MAIQPTIGMIPIRPWMIILPNQPGSWNGHAKLSPTLVIGGIVRCAGQSGKVRPAIYHVVDTEGPRRFSTRTIVGPCVHSACRPQLCPFPLPDAFRAAGLSNAH